MATWLSSSQMKMLNRLSRTVVSFTTLQRRRQPKQRIRMACKFSNSLINKLKNTSQTERKRSCKNYYFLFDLLFFRFPDGTIKCIFEDGEEESIFPDGTIQRIEKSGIKAIEFANGQKDILFPDGTRVREFPDGRVRTTFPDGRTETKTAKK